MMLLVSTHVYTIMQKPTYEFKQEAESWNIIQYIENS